MMAPPLEMTPALDNLTHQPEMTAGEPPRIMVVDDDQGFREMLRDFLADDGFDVVGEAPDGVEAVTQADRLKPDVIVMDLRMPRMDGLEATRRIKDTLPITQVVILSAYEDPALKRGAERAGVYCYLIKGCSPAMLVDVLRFAWSFKVGLEQGGAPAREALEGLNGSEPNSDR
jgi:DNA-binding NarL/FixJ family response regulator